MRVVRGSDGSGVCGVCVESDECVCLYVCGGVLVCVVHESVRACGGVEV